MANLIAEDARKVAGAALLASSDAGPDEQRRVIEYCSERLARS